MKFSHLQNYTLISELDAETQKALFTLLGNLLKLLEARKVDKIKYQQQLLLIPEEYRDSFHELLVVI